MSDRKIPLVAADPSSRLVLAKHHEEGPAAIYVIERHSEVLTWPAIA